MTDREYAALMYCHIFFADDDNGDAYAPGILKELDSLSQREQIVLDSYFRCGKTLEQTGSVIGPPGKAPNIF